MSNRSDSLATVLQGFMDARRLKATDLIRASGLSRQTVYSLLQGKGRPQTDTLMRVARVIGEDSLVSPEIEQDKIARVFLELAAATGVDPDIAMRSVEMNREDQDQRQQGGLTDAEEAEFARLDARFRNIALAMGREYNLKTPAGKRAYLEALRFFAGEQYYEAIEDEA